MREYSKVYPQIWIGNTAREIKKFGVETQLLAQYLISSPHAHMIGIYYLPISFIAHETGMPANTVANAMQNLIQIDFCSYDENKEYVWVHNMGFYQIAKLLKPNDNQVKSVVSYIKNLPDLPFINQFYEKYSEAFNLQTKASLQRPLEAPSKELRSQKIEQAKEIEKEQGQKHVALTLITNTAKCLEPEVLSIPLQENSRFPITQSLIDNWEKAYPSIDVKFILKKIQEWNSANPDKRKTTSNVQRHIELWLAREQEKQNSDGKLKRNDFFKTNQSVAEEWLKTDSIFEAEECSNEYFR